MTQLEGETVAIQPQEKVSPPEKPDPLKTHVNEQISLFDDFTENPVLQELRVGHLQYDTDASHDGCSRFEAEIIKEACRLTGFLSFIGVSILG